MLSDCWRARTSKLPSLLECRPRNQEQSCAGEKPDYGYRSIPSPRPDQEYASSRRAKEKSYEAQDGGQYSPPDILPE
jgi:hypothetical protein